MIWDLIYHNDAVSLLLHKFLISCDFDFVRWGQENCNISSWRNANCHLFPFSHLDLWFDCSDSKRRGWCWLGFFSICLKEHFLFYYFNPIKQGFSLFHKHTVTVLPYFGTVFIVHTLWRDSHNAELNPSLCCWGSSPTNIRRRTDWWLRLVPLRVSFLLFSSSLHCKVDSWIGLDQVSV